MISLGTLTPILYLCGGFTKLWLSDLSVATCLFHTLCGLATVFWQESIIQWMAFSDSGVCLCAAVCACVL